MSGAGLTIREATLGDAEAILSILNPIIMAGTYTIMDTLLSVEAERDFIARFPERGVFHVAEREGRLVGFQDVEPLSSSTPAFAHVGTIGTFVDLSRRRQGIGSALFEATFEAARRKGFEKLLTYIRVDNPAALESYLRRGFRVVGTAQKQAKVNGRYVDEIIVEAFL